MQLVFGNAAASPPAHEVEGEPGVVRHLFVTNSDKEVYFIGGGGCSFACAVTAIFLLTAAAAAAAATAATDDFSSQDAVQAAVVDRRVVQHGHVASADAIKTAMH